MLIRCPLKVRKVLEVADRVLALRMGEVIYEGPATDLLENEDRLRSIYL
jgi:ABC-type branched-subunit amino acid transport system ATPase component